LNQTIIALDARTVGNRKTGDTTYWTGLIHGLATAESDFRYLLYSNAPKPPEIPDTERLRWIELPGRNNRWWSLVSFPLAARKAGAFLIHTQYNMSPLAKAGITTIHDVSFFVGPEWFKPRDRFLLSRFVPASAKRAQRVITVSETSKRDILKYIPAAEGKISVTPLAGGLGIKNAPNKDLSHLGIEKPFLLTVGTRWPRKNMKLALDAVEMLPASLPHKLAVTGHPAWDETEVKGRAFATGYVSDEDLSALYSAADLYLVPSRYEGFGITLLEAFTCGCPVLTSTGGSLPEVAGDAAQVENTWDASSWARTIEMLLGDSGKLESLRKKGLERARGFSWKATAQSTEDAYREALK
jgi:glycosyltransferase involved in cell wall biosynthesis